VLLRRAPAVRQLIASRSLGVETAVAATDRDASDLEDRCGGDVRSSIEDEIPGS